jgi:two-component system sensor histidine kinase/response regulator
MYKILLVEDEIVLRETVTEILEFHDFEVLTAVSGESALNILTTKMPDIIVSDVMMPGMSGFDFILKVKGIPGLANIPFIFLSAFAGHEEHAEALKLGASDFVTKPFRFANLVTIINSNLNACTNKNY